MPELDEKRRRVVALLDSEGLDAIVLRKPGNVAWYSCGGRTHILATPDVGVADVIVRRDGNEIVTAVNEAARMEFEELESLNARLRVLPWSDDRTRALPTGQRVGSDAPFAGVRDVSKQMEVARRSLTGPEVVRYRDLGRDTAAAMTATCNALRPDMTEFDAAAILSAQLYERDADAIVLLVAGAERLPHHRHPLPTARPLGPLAMLVACARRHGLIANITRFVAFAGLRPGERERFERLLHVDVAFNAATVPGMRVGDVFATGIDAYGRFGFDADEWRQHHQGGPTGYESRDYIADARSDARVDVRQPFAWNPSVPSLKSEDTVIAQHDGVEILTLDPEWPTVTVDGIVRPVVLER